MPEGYGFCLHAEQERTSYDIFVNGKLSEGVSLVNGHVRGKAKVTSSLGADAWGDPIFEIHGLNINISSVGFSQIHIRMVAGSDRVNKPSYADVGIITSRGPAININQFPFRPYQTDDPNYMMRSANHSATYAAHPSSDVLCNCPGVRGKG